MNSYPMCRICGESFSDTVRPVHVRGHEFECCDRCKEFVARQPVVFPGGTERAGETVQWWDLRALYAALTLAAPPIGLPVNRVVLLRKFAAIGLSDAAPRNLVEVIISRQAAKGICVAAGLRFEGELEEAYDGGLSLAEANPQFTISPKFTDAVATTLSAVKKEAANETEIYMIHKVARALAVMFKNADPIFDSQVFLQFSGVLS